MSAEFTPSRIDRTASITLNAPPDQVFPLFGPVREAEWAAGWSPRIAYSVSPLADEEGAVFVTSHPGEPDTTWIVVRFDPQECLVEYARVTPGQSAVRVIIRCQPAPGGRTTARVTYQVTTLAGGAYHFAEMHYPEEMAHWETAINHALAAAHSAQK